jgi:translation initiation factor 1 (eIF-1/SUI1)
MKRKFKCAASIQTDKGGREVIQLQGNHLANVKTWLIDQKILGKQEADTRIIIHGI